MHTSLQMMQWALKEIRRESSRCQEMKAKIAIISQRNRLETNKIG